MLNLKNNLLLEIYTEEMPENKILLVSNYFFKIFKSKLYENNINYKNIEYLLTNKRIGLIIYNMYYKKNILYKIKGPKLKYIFENNKYTNIFYKWIKKNKVNTKNIKFILKEENSWIYYYKNVNIKYSIKNILKNIFKECLNSIFKKFNVMKWNKNNLYFIRPIRNILFLLNNKIINFKIFNINSNKITYINNNTNNYLVINDFKDYKKLLKSNNVFINYNYRKKILKSYFKKIENKLNSKIIINDKIIEKNVLSTECPEVFYIKINNKLIFDKYILIKTIYSYYNFLLMYDKNNNLLPYFLYISNTCIKDKKFFINNSKVIIENILKEIKFLFKLDTKLPFIKNINKLKNVIFRKNFGSLYDKILRVKKISIFICKNLNIKYYNSLLLFFIYKCDLVTSIVKEFSKLRGYIGYYYSLINKLEKNISIPIKEQYDYKNIKNNFFYNKISLILCLSDKFDTSIVNIYYYFEKNINFINLCNDPYEIKRNINHIIFILVNNNINISFIHIIKKSLIIHKFKDKKFFLFIKNIFINRIKLFFFKKKYKKRIINSVLSKESKNLYNINYILKIINSNEFLPIINTFKRIKNLLNNIDINYNLKFNKLSKLEIKFKEIIKNIKNNINKLKNNNNFNEILKLLINFSNFINNLLNKLFISNKKNKNLILFLNESINILSSINDILIFIEN